MCNEPGVKMGDQMTITAFHDDTVQIFGCAREPFRRRKACLGRCGEGGSSQSFNHVASNPLSDFNLVVATNQYVLPVLSYLMLTRHWPFVRVEKC